MTFALKPQQTILFTGDSITDCGRRDTFAPLGNGYVRMACDLITAKYPGHQLKVINTGIGGNTAFDLKNRWSDDVINHKPDWVSVMIGINDCHRWFGDQTLNEHSLGGFAEHYDAVLTRTAQQTDADIILMDPFYIATDQTADSNQLSILRLLPGYIKIVADMVAKHKTRHVKLHETFSKLQENYPADRFCPEPVHPNDSGHTAIAYQWLRTLGW